MERVTKKSFIITTLLMPVIMLGLMMAPVLIAMFSESDNRNILVIDRSADSISSSLNNTPVLTFVRTDVSVDSARKVQDVDAVLVIPEGIYGKNGTLQLYTNGASSMEVESAITGQFNNIIEAKRLRDYSIENLDEIISAVHADVKLQSLRNDEDSTESSTMLSYMLGLVLTLMLYMCLLLYGQMVMTSIIEEKNNRVLEIVVSSVKPTQLMLGKICGIGLVAVTQIVIWGLLLAAMSAFVLPAVLPAGVSADMAALSAGGAPAGNLNTDLELLQALAMLGNVAYIIKLFGLLLLFLIGGFMLYSAIYAAIGSAVDNIQDAGQLQSIVVFPIIIGIVVAMQAASDPASSMAMWTSMIPFTSPMVMMARIPFGIPAWEIVVSLAILVVSFFVVVWFAAKIYRVGIFMYGKKPNVKELIRWISYK